MEYKYEIVDRWNICSGIYKEIINRSFAIPINLTIESQFKEVKHFAENISSFTLQLMVSYYPPRNIEMVRMMADVYFGIKEETNCFANDLFGDKSLNIIAECYEKELPEIMGNFQSQYNPLFNIMEMEVAPIINRDNSIRSIETALRGFLAQE